MEEWFDVDLLNQVPRSGFWDRVWSTGLGARAQSGVRLQLDDSAAELVKALAEICRKKAYISLYSAI